MKAIRKLPDRLLFPLDQILSSTSSALFSVAALAILSSSDFGEFALGLAGTALASGVVRKGLLEAEVIRQGSGQRSSPTERFAGLAGSSVGLGLGIILPWLTACFAMGKLSAVHAVGFAVVGLVSIKIDVLRYISFSETKPSRALIVDVTWLGLFLVEAGTCAMAGAISFNAMLVLYSTSGYVSAIFWRREIQTTPARAILRRVRRSLRELGYSIEFLLSIAAGNVVVLLLVLVLDLDSLGKYRAIIVIFQPLTNIVYAVRLYLLSQPDWGVRPRRIAFQSALAYLIVSICWSAFLMLAHGLGLLARAHALAGVSTGLMLAAGCSETIRTVAQVGFDWSRVDDRLGEVVAIRSFESVGLVGGTAVAASAFGLPGVMFVRAFVYGASGFAIAFWRICTGRGIERLALRDAPGSASGPNPTDGRNRVSASTAANAGCS